MMPMRLEPAALRSRVKHSTTEPLGSLTCKLFPKTDRMLRSVKKVLALKCESIRLNMPLGAQTNSLIETVFLGTHNIYFG